MSAKVLPGLALVAVATACVPTGPGGSGGIFGPQYATGQQVINAVTNFSAVGTETGGTAFCEYHAPNGQLLGNDAQGSYQGSWAVNGDQLCLSYPQRGINRCANITIDAQRMTYHGDGQVVRTANLVGGNVC